MKKQTLILIIFAIFTLIMCGTVSASPDLVVTSVNATDNVSPGGTVTINDTVKNQGNETANGFYVGYYIQNEYAVVKKPASQSHASIYKDKVVWADYRYDRPESDLYYKDLTNGSDGYIAGFSNQSNPAIYGDVIVWQDNYLGYWNILGYKIPGRDDPIEENIYILNMTSANQMNPSIYMDKIVWQDDRNGNWDIYLYDFPMTGDIAMPGEKIRKETTQITKNSASQINPYVNGNYIVWQDNRNGNWDIYAYDLSTGDEIPICTFSGDQTNPTIYGDSILWQDNRNGNWDIYMYDISTNVTTQISNNPSDQENPAIYGDKIVWQDNRNGNWDIYMYDLTLGIERQLTTNTGNQTDPAIYDNKVVWTDDRNGNEDIYVTDNLTLVPAYTRYISSLAPGESNSALTNITLPSDLKANVNYYIIAMADGAYDNSVSESNENNNIKFSSPMIVPDVDLTIPSISGPAAAQSGGSMIIVNTINNTGTKNSNPFYIKFYLSKDSDITSSDIYIGQRYVSGGLKAGASSTAYTNLILPSNLSGNYYIGAIIDPANNTCETNKLNNIGICPATIEICAPDLISTSVSTGSTLYKRGDTVTIQDTVQNQGKAASNGFYITFYLSKDSNITSSDTYLGQRYVSGLNAGESSTNSTTITLPANLSGNYYIGAIIDQTDEVYETNELNNIGICPTTIEICAPDLISTAVSTGSTSYKIGDTVTIQNTVQNQGKIASGGFYVQLYLSKDSNITSSDTYLGQRYVSGLNAGESSTAYTSIALPSNLSGNYYIGTIIDPTNSVLESNELNNIGICPTIEICTPDLAATSVSAGSTSYRRGSKITIKNTVKNQGKVVSGGFYVKFYLSKSKYTTGSGVYIGKRYISSLGAGVSNRAYTRLTIPTTIRKGLYYCKIVIYPVNSAMDSNKSNNAICSSRWMNIF